MAWRRKLCVGFQLSTTPDPCMPPLLDLSGLGISLPGARHRALHPNPCATSVEAEPLPNVRSFTTWSLWVKTSMGKLGNILRRATKIITRAGYRMSPKMFFSARKAKGHRDQAYKVMREWGMVEIYSCLANPKVLEPGTSKKSF